MSILTDAEDLINGERAESYGPAHENLEKIAGQWMLYLGQKYGQAKEGYVYACISAEDVCWMMADLKKCRQMHSAKRDNITDAAGYMGLIEHVMGGA